MYIDWNKKYSWCFSPLGTGDRVGVNNAGIGIFKKKPYIGLSKEIIQNVTDAKDPAVKGPAKAVFEVMKISKSDFPGADRLSDVIKKCADYYHEGDDGQKMGVLKQAAEELLDSGKDIPVLKISDYNTIGLTGAHEEKGTNWTGLVREISATNKGNESSGSFGVGKFAPFNFSRLRTIVYSTYNVDKETALQGKTILTTFIDDDGKRRQNVGLFGLLQDDDCKAVYDESEIPEVYRRKGKENGTDLFVLGFKKDPDWMQQITVSVLESFFYTIFKGNLEVTIRDGEKCIEIRKDNLTENMEMIADYYKNKEIEFTAPPYLDLLLDNTGKTKHFVEDFRNMGKIELYLKLDPDCDERKVVEMRKAGMKIQEDEFRLNAYFRGIFVATGEGAKSDDPEENINSFLRKCENQAHDAWSKDEYENNKDKAGKILNAIHRWIAEMVKSEMPDVQKDETAAYGLSDLLPNQESSGNDNQEENAYASFEPIPEPLTIVPVVNKSTRTRASDIIIAEDSKDDIADEIVLSDDKTTLVPGGESEVNPEPRPPHPPYPGPYPGPFPGPEPGPDPKPDPDGEQLVPGQVTPDYVNGKQRKLHRIPLSSVKTPFDNKNGVYRVSFIPGKNVLEAYVRLRTGSDDGDKSSVEVVSAKDVSGDLEIRKGDIILKGFSKGQKIVIYVTLKNAKRRSLEVSAYAE